MRGDSDDLDYVEQWTKESLVIFFVVADGFSAVSGT